MEFTATREAILTPLQALMGVVERKQTFPILANVLLTVEKGFFSLLGTDMEVELITSGTPLLVKAGGSTTVPAKKWYEILRSLPEDVELSFKHVNNKLEIRTDHSRFALTTLPIDNFPRMEETAALKECQIPESVFLSLLKKTSFAVAEQDVRHYLNGLFIDCNPKHLRLIGSDGHRLAMIETHLPFPVEMQLLLPRKAVMELTRVLTPQDRNLTLQLSPTHLQVKTENLSFASKLIDAKFPPYQNTIPKNPNQIIVLDKESLKQALHRAITLSNENNHAIRLRAEHNLAVLTSSNPLHEEAEVSLPASFLGEPFEAAFNGRYLLDFLGVMDGEEVEIGYTSPKHSLRVNEPGNHQFVYVVMPMFL